MTAGLRFVLLGVFALVALQSTKSVRAQPLSVPIASQNSQVDKSAAYPLCEPRAIDVTFSFADKPAGAQTITLHLRNQGTSTCRLAGALSPSFALDGHSMLQITSCWYCAKAGSPMRETPGPDQIVLGPDERALVDLRWSSVGESCYWTDWTFLNFAWAPKSTLIFTPSNWPMHVCSTVQGLGYRREPASDPKVSLEPLRIAVSPETIYSDEYATLHVEVVEPKGEPNPAVCADLYTVRQDLSTIARLDPLSSSDRRIVPSYTPMQFIEDKERSWPSWRKAGERTCSVPGDTSTADAVIPARDLPYVTHVEWRTAPSHDKDPAFLVAATHFTVLDVDSLAPNWGETVQGIRAGLSVDRQAFRMGEKIPLHIRWENVNAPVELAQGECQEPWPSLEILDENLKVTKNVPLQPACMGHGWGPFIIKRGAPQRSFLDEYASILPGPGVYYLVTAWTPKLLEKINPESKPASLFRREGTFGSPYATARSLPVRVVVQP